MNSGSMVNQFETLSYLTMPGKWKRGYGCTAMVGRYTLTKLGHWTVMGTCGCAEEEYPTYYPSPRSKKVTP